MSPRQSKQNQRNSAKSPEAIESALAAQRAQLIGDVEALSARLAPQALTSMARHSAQATAAEWRSRASVGTARLKARVGLVKDDPLVGSADSAASVDAAGPGVRSASRGAPGAGVTGLPAAVGSRLSRLIDDARDGDPASLAIVTGTIVVLAGCSVVAVVKAVRR